MRSGELDPRRVAMTFLISVGTGMRLAGCWMYDWISTVIRPPDVAAIFCSSP
jgi:hypothetical protein